MITGKIISGIKQGAFFTQLDWVQEQCLEKLGFKPWPGTLNLEISDEDIPIIAAFMEEKVVELIPPDSNFCSGRAFAVSVGGIPGAMVVPAEEVRVHGKNIIEILSPVRLKDALGVKDGDFVSLIVANP